MTQAVVATGYGGPEVLELVDVATPRPGPGEVRVEVRAAGVNPFDAKVYSGRFGADPAKLPMRLGSEASGVVAEAGPGAAGPAGPVRVGDHVIVHHAPGAYATDVVARGSAVVPKPPELPWAAAGGLLLAGVTAAHAMVAVDPREGETVLVHGATGGVGLMAVQLAVARGARVIGTGRPEHHGLLRRLGAVPVASGRGLGPRLRAVAPRGVDAAIDTTGADDAIETSVELVADRARIATIAAFERGARTGVKLLGNAPGADPGAEIRAAARLDLLAAVRAARLEVVVARTFPLHEAAGAHRLLMGRHPPGKIVLIP